MAENQHQAPPEGEQTSQSQILPQSQNAEPQTEAPHSYASLDTEAPSLTEETAVEGLDAILAIGPYSGDAVRTMAGVKEFGVKLIALEALLARANSDLEMLRDTVDFEEGRMRGPDAEEKRQAELKEVQNLIEGVDAMQKRYVDLVWETRLLATKVEAHLLDLVNHVLPCVVDYQTDEDERHADLRGFINRRKPPFTSTESEDPPRAFLKFEHDLKEFLDQAITYAANYYQTLHTRNESLRSQKDDLDKRSKEYQDIVSKTPAKVGLTLGVTAVGAVSALSVPVASVGIAATGLSVAVADTVKIATHIKRIYDVGQERKSLLDLPGLDEAVERTSEIKSRLLDEPSKIPNLPQSSQVILRLWDIAAEDAEMVDGYDLEDVVHDEDLLLKIENISITYKAYASALKEFTVDLRSAGLFVGRSSI